MKSLNISNIQMSTGQSFQLIVQNPQPIREQNRVELLTLRLSVLAALSEVRAEAGGKERGGEEGGAWPEEGRGRQWTAMEDMLLVYWCCWVLLAGEAPLLSWWSEGGGAAGWGGHREGDIEISCVGKTHK